MKDTEDMIWRALFLALGITMIVLGVQMFFVEQVEVKRLRPARANATAGQYNAPYQQASYQQPQPQTPTVLITRKDWMPWSLLAVGSIIVIYTFTIPGRGGGGS